MIIKEVLMYLKLLSTDKFPLGEELVPNNIWRIRGIGVDNKDFTLMGMSYLE